MNRLTHRSFVGLLALTVSLAAVPLTTAIAQAQQTPQEAAAGLPLPDVVYGHKMGMALTFDVFYPPPATTNHGVGVLFIVSGGFYSHWAPPQQMARFTKPLTDAGFTVFTVRHGSSPKFEIPEIVDDVRRSVRYVRANAARFGIDPEKLGVYGISAGGHLSLMLGTTGEDGDPAASDPLDRVSSRVQAVVAWVAPTDLTIMVHEAPESLPAYQQFPALRLPLAQAKEFSPLHHVTSDDAPTLLLVGEKDELVPIQHSERIEQAMSENGVTVQLNRYPHSGHGLVGDELIQANQAMIDWFQKQLLNQQ